MRVIRQCPKCLKFWETMYFKSESEKDAVRLVVGTYDLRLCATCSALPTAEIVEWAKTLTGQDGFDRIRDNAVVVPESSGVTVDDIA